MNWQSTLLFILYLECFILILLMIALFIQRMYGQYKEKMQLISVRAITQVILGCLQRKKETDWKEELKKYSGSLELLKVLESFRNRFSGEDWKDLQEEIAKTFLLSDARRSWKSTSWFKRNQAVRTFVLCPLLTDKEILLSLMDDPVFLVRSHAAAALLKLKIKEGVEKAVYALSLAKGYASDYYHDLIIENETSEISLWIQELAMENKGRSFHLACLKLLAGRMQTLTYPHLMKDLTSDDREIRFAAIRIFTRNPQKGSLEVLFQCMDDPDKDVREEGFFGAVHFLSKRTLEKLEQGLTDPAWEVRRRAAFSLKRMGRAGLEILQKQTPENKEAYAMSQYVLQFDEWLV